MKKAHSSSCWRRASRRPSAISSRAYSPSKRRYESRSACELPSASAMVYGAWLLGAGLAVLGVATAVGPFTWERYLGRLVGWYQPGEPAGFIASVIGAMLLLLIYRMVAGKRG